MKMLRYKSRLRVTENKRCSLKTKQNKNVNVNSNKRFDKIETNFLLFYEQVKHFLESLILAQDERWRRA